MGLFGGGNSSTAVSNDNRDLRQTAGDASVLIGAGAQATGIDPGVVATYLGGITAQTDAVKTMAGFSRDELKNMGDAVTHIYDVAGKNALTSWEHTIDKASDITASQTATASTLAQSAVLAANPQQSANDTLIKIGGLVAVAFVAWALLRRKSA